MRPAIKRRAAMPNQKGKKKKPIGRPTKYTKAMCLQAIELGRSGASKTEIAVDLGISPTNAFYAWQEKHPEFREAIKEAEYQAMVWWERRGREATFSSSGFNATAYIFQMKNRFSEHYKNRIAHEGGDGGPIQVTFKSFTPPPGTVLIKSPTDNSLNLNKNCAHGPQ